MSEIKAKGGYRKMQHTTTAQIAASITLKAMELGSVKGTPEEVSQYFTEIFKRISAVEGIPTKVIFSWKDSESVPEQQ